MKDWVILKYFVVERYQGDQISFRRRIPDFFLYLFKRIATHDRICELIVELSIISEYNRNCRNYFFWFGVVLVNRNIQSFALKFLLLSHFSYWILSSSSLYEMFSSFSFSVFLSQCNNLLLLAVTKRNSNVALILFFLYRLTTVRTELYRIVFSLIYVNLILLNLTSLFVI